MKKYFLLLLLAFVFNCLKAQTLLIKKGIWQATIQRNDSARIQFNFIAGIKNGKPAITILNADEKLLADNIKPYKDSLLITLPFFSASLRLKVLNENLLSGVYVKGTGNKNTEIPIVAKWGIKERYKSFAKARNKVSGTWDISFKGGKKNSQAVGSFQQTVDGKVTGSVLTLAGDYRFLEGIVSGDTLKLSGFDGGFSSFFSGIIQNDSTITEGNFYFGPFIHETWQAKKNDDAKLPDEFGYSHLRPGETSLSFSFKSTGGKIVSIKDKKYEGKVVIVQILGSWCPNCMDETAFLSEYYNKNKSRGVEIIGLAYERTENFTESKMALEPFSKRFNVQYPFLITGVTPSDPQKTEKTIPQIDNINAFPTTIFIDKKGNVKKIHTGYDGPGTGKFYAVFVKEFNEIINELLEEE